MMEKNLVGLVQREREKDLVLKGKGGKPMTEIVEKKKKERYERIPTEIPGVSLRVEPGTTLGMSRRAIAKFYKHAKRFFRIDSQIKKLTKQRDAVRESLLKTAKFFKGLHGVISEKDVFVVTVSIKETSTWIAKKLKRCLGAASSKVIKTTFLAHIELPGDFITAKGQPLSINFLKGALTTTLLDLGVPSEDIGKVMYLETDEKVNETALHEMVAKGQVKIPKGAKKTEITWAVTPDILKP